MTSFLFDRVGVGVPGFAIKFRERRKLSAL